IAPRLLVSAMPLRAWAFWSLRRLVNCCSRRGDGRAAFKPLRPSCLSRSCRWSPFSTSMGPTAKNSVRRKSPRRMAINGRRDWPCGVCSSGCSFSRAFAPLPVRLSSLLTKSPMSSTSVIASSWLHLSLDLPASPAALVEWFSVSSPICLPTSGIHAQYCNDRDRRRRVDDPPRSEPNVVAVCLRDIFWHWLRLSRGDLLRAHGGPIFRKRIRVDPWLLHGGCRRRRRFGLMARRRPSRLDRQLSHFVRSVHFSSRRF